LLQDPLDEEVEESVESAEVDGRYGYEEDRDGGRLDQRVAIRPLHFLQLLPAGNQESDHAAALAFGLRLFLFLGELLALAPLLLGALALLAFFLGLRFGALGRAWLRRVRGLQLALGSAGGDTRLDRFDLGYLAGDATWVSCWASDSSRRPPSERLRSSASRARRSALRCARVFAIGSYRVSLWAV